ncbi:NUDIX domain-containing protein (plasmid) [Sinorhizobium garamanticum]|uniref:NUDIX domain-containing protein n=1 Tax=Sinorhizobium garamanticum TaxID=680247 RepID=A0ABY8DPF4_9HYPH|nr:NUDIX domain-containing protein [Sinorhizobium garamanticum]WEX91782.1 NUDIX domain-containing protein [Sinorhizobium garamanticum]
MGEQFAPASNAARQDAVVWTRARVEQAGAICFRTSAKDPPEVLLVASRRNGRWGIPKGRIETGETSGMAAAREALEEAGVKGRVSTDAIGSFVYTKNSSELAYHINVHLLEVQEMLVDFPEKESRTLRWAPIATAVEEVSRAELRNLLFFTWVAAAL